MIIDVVLVCGLCRIRLKRTDYAYLKLRTAYFFIEPSAGQVILVAQPFQEQRKISFRFARSSVGIYPGEFLSALSAAVRSFLAGFSGSRWFWIWIRWFWICICRFGSVVYDLLRLFCSRGAGQLIVADRIRDLRCYHAEDHGNGHQYR